MAPTDREQLLIGDSGPRGGRVAQQLFRGLRIKAALSLPGTAPIRRAAGARSRHPADKATRVVTDQRKRLMLTSKPWAGSCSI